MQRVQKYLFIATISEIEPSKGYLCLKGNTNIEQS